MNSTTHAQFILEFKMICGTKFCMNYERLWAFVYRHSITCPQEIKRSLCPDETHYRCLEGRVKSGGNAEWLGNQLQHESPPGQKAIINLHLATLGSQPSFTPEIHLSSPLKHLSMSHPTQGSAGTPLPTHAAGLSSQTNFPSQQACSTPAVCQVTARSTYHGYFN